VERADASFERLLLGAVAFLGDPSESEVCELNVVAALRLIEEVWEL